MLNYIQFYKHFSVHVHNTKPSYSTRKHTSNNIISFDYTNLSHSEDDQFHDISDIQHTPDVSNKNMFYVSIEDKETNALLAICTVNIKTKYLDVDKLYKETNFISDNLPHGRIAELNNVFLYSKVINELPKYKHNGSSYILYGMIDQVCKLCIKYNIDHLIFVMNEDTKNDMLKNEFNFVKCGRSIVHNNDKFYPYVMYIKYILLNLNGGNFIKYQYMKSSL